MKVYDYIITGAGASGLMLAYRMASNTFFDKKTILIIDQEKKTTDDRTWCYWEKGGGEWDHLLHKRWNTIRIKSQNFLDDIKITPYEYKMIRSSKFYNEVWSLIEKKPNITFQKGTVVSIEEDQNEIVVNCEEDKFNGKKAFNSVILNDEYLKQTKYPVLKQHFTGWFIDTPKDSFDESLATFMDFDIEQKDNTRFMYILPTSKRTALFEYTLFSKDLLEKSEYEKEIEKYLNNLGIVNYSIVEKEKGVIPMTSFKFWKRNTNKIIHIGTNGGWSKASTGFTFMNIVKKTNEIVEALEYNQPFQKFRKTRRFWVYDLLLLDVLDRNNGIGAQFFSKLFQRNSFEKIFNFLDEKTNFLEELRLMLSMPPRRFLFALTTRIFRK